ncbi:MAG: DUF1295 domain-containing protein [Caldimonas sp.]
MAEPLAPLEVAGAGLALIVALAAATWLASVARRDVSLVDRFWPVYIVGAASIYFVLTPDPGARGACMLALAIAWGLRLCAYITQRNWGHGEDRRYRAIRARNEPRFALKSLYLVFGLQALLAWIVSAPFLAAMRAGGAPGWRDLAGIALTLFGIVFEAVADAQMRRFKAEPDHAGTVMDRGLWRFSRHPNYFGEACVWWGFWLIAVAGAGRAGVWSVVAPALMTLLLLKVSGVSLLEKDIVERRPAYRDYIARTNAFVPGRPNRNGA